MAKTSTGLIEYARGQLGRPYWYGTFGQISSAKLYREKQKQYPSQYPPQKWTEASFMNQLNVKVHDCVGLIKGYVMGDGDPNKATPYNSKYDVSANGLYAKCIEKGSIKTIPEVPGLVVWKDKHIGIYIGGGYAIEARGHAYGVVKTKVTDRPWTNWGRLPSDWIQYETTPEVKYVEIEMPVLRKGDKGLQAVKTLQACLDVYGYGLSIDGSFGGKTDTALRDFQKKHGLTVDGVCGKNSWNKLLK